jgi:hypothetical protein
LVKGGGAGAAPTNSSITDNGTIVSTTEGFSTSYVPSSTGNFGIFGGTAVSNYTSNLQTDINLSANAVGILNSSAFPVTFRVVNQQNGTNVDAVPLSSETYCSGTMTVCNGGEAFANVTGGTMAAVAGFGSEIFQTGGTSTQAYTYLGYPLTISGGTVTSGFGVLLGAPSVSGGGVLTNYYPIAAYGRPGGGDLTLFQDTNLIATITARTTSGTTNTPSVQLTGSGYDTSAHEVDWLNFGTVSSNAGASTFRWQSRIGAAGYADRMLLSDGGGLAVTSIQGVGTTFTGSGCGINTLVGGALIGSFKVTGGACSVAITFGAYTTPQGLTAHGSHCTATDSTTLTGVVPSSETTTTVNLTASYTNGDVITWECHIF